MCLITVIMTYLPKPQFPVEIAVHTTLHYFIFLPFLPANLHFKPPKSAGMKTNIQKQLTQHTKSDTVFYVCVLHFPHVSGV
jgi:hypothetical protein